MKPLWLSPLNNPRTTPTMSPITLDILDFVPFRAFVLATMLSFMAFTSPVKAGPISIFGIDWGMSLSEMTAVFENKGYTCGVTTAENDKEAGVTWCAQGEFQTFSEKLVVFRKNGRISFFCQVYNGCDFSAEQVAQSLINQGLVRQFTRTTTSDGNAYFFKGDLGDEIEVKDEWIKVYSAVLSKPVPLIVLVRGGYIADLNFD